ncbi:MAG: hypothetical protein P8Z00_00605 [Anaerolineales bacterium]
MNRRLIVFFHALLQTYLSLLRLLATSFRRLQQEGSLNMAPVGEAGVAFSGNGKSPAAGVDTQQARWQAFNWENAGLPEGGRVIGDEYRHAYAYLEKLARQYTNPTFWDGRHVDVSSWTSLLTLLRFLVAQLGQTARESIWQEAE